MTYDNLSILKLRMILIREGHRRRVAEYACGFLECHTMLDAVHGRLSGVPFKFKTHRWCFPVLSI